MSQGKKVFVGLSGGVDSSVAALRLKHAGYNVTGVFIKVWHPDFLVCNWEQERLDAMRVAANLGIPFLTCDGEAAYRDEVAHYFINAYQAGLTPNPDVLCNQHVKFGVFLKFAKDRGADVIATGHYANRVIHEDGTPALKRGNDQDKDQTYFLWSLTKEQLSESIFPVGDTVKNQIRTEASEAALPVAAKHDSQGICFLGQIDIGDFLSHYITLVPGLVCDMTGAVIGEHKGAYIYTIGQRHGFTIHTTNPDRTPYYVVAKDITRNTLTVNTARATSQASSQWQLTNVVLRHAIPSQCLAQIRYRQVPFQVDVSNYNPVDKTLTVTPQTSTERPALGQSCVLYTNDICLGGGMIAAC